MAEAEVETEPDFKTLISQLYSEKVKPLPVYTSKRTTDIALSSLGLILTSPIFLGAAAAIKIEGWLDPKTKGPVFYVSERIGEDGEPFKMYKFRSMDVGSEDRLKDLLGGEYDWTTLARMKDDPRTTRVGRFIRRFCIDEYPQLVNVLMGNMSLVGPRPYIEHHAKILAKRGNYHRFRIRPGVTGPVQMRRKGSIPYGDPDKLEEEYVRSYESGNTFFSDLCCIAKSIPYIMFGYAYDSKKGGHRQNPV